MESLLHLGPSSSVNDLRAIGPLCPDGGRQADNGAELACSWRDLKNSRLDLTITELVAQLCVPGFKWIPLGPKGAVMNFTLYGIDIPLWLLFSLALIGLATCLVGGIVVSVSIVKRLMKPAWRRLVRTPV
jgi:hypothetical protein